MTERLTTSRAADPETLTVALGAHAYPIVLVAEPPGPALAATAREVLPAGARRVLIVTDDNVAPLYGEGVDAALTGAGYEVATCVLPAGEAHKTTDAALRVVDAALAARLTRHDAIVALGGGVVGDIAGFAAAITHRGVALVQAPTTLLAQVDSAVGGKTGVNHARGKNLIGAFWQPRAVVSSQAVLTTLPAREVRCGLAEAVKHGLLTDAALLDWIDAHADALLALAPRPVAHLVAAWCRIKADIVARDEREELAGGPRALLNLGHTFGHAFENLLGYGVITHGEGVALGMVLAARLSERLGVGPAGLEADVVRRLARLALPHAPDAPDLPRLPALIEAARGDKKADPSGGVRFVLLEALGRAITRRLSWEEIAAALGEGRP
ncbi:MAG: 3-dehydroquinate synthase [Deltaproteobacteria bacterium]|nr:3-dehydroquinate synthase [Deltaproteobacteria bacterium]